jgi:DNA-binding MarR family transcriptional regulator
MDKDGRKREESSCNCGALRKASRRMSRIYDEALSPVGLGSSQHTILAELSRRTEQAPTLWELADALVMDRTTITRNLRPLERDGYITVLPSEVDRRSKLVALTAAGKQKFEEASVFWLQAQKKFEQAFGAAQARLFRSQLLEIAKDDTFAAAMTINKESTLL